MTDKEAKAAEDALKLAYIKLVQVGGFATVDGVNTRDDTARAQILGAIRMFDPKFSFGQEEFVPDAQFAQYCAACGWGRGDHAAFDTQPDEIDYDYLEGFLARHPELQAALEAAAGLPVTAQTAVFAEINRTLESEGASVRLASMRLRTRGAQ